MGESVPEPETPAKSLSLRRSVRNSVSIFILDPRVSCKIVLSVHARVFRIFTYFFCALGPLQNRRLPS